MSATARGQVRRASARDLDHLALLWIALHAHHAALDPFFELRTDAEAEICRLLAGELSDPNTAIFVWDEEGLLVGFCTARVVVAPAILCERSRGEITHLAVREDARRRGVGTGLAAAAQAWIAGRDVARVEVRVVAKNAAAQAFWRRLGYGDLMDVLQRRL